MTIDHNSMLNIVGSRYIWRTRGQASLDNLKGAASSNICITEFVNLDRGLIFYGESFIRHAVIYIIMPEFKVQASWIQVIPFDMEFAVDYVSIMMTWRLAECDEVVPTVCRWRKFVMRAQLAASSLYGGFKWCV